MFAAIALSRRAALFMGEPRLLPVTIGRGPLTFVTAERRRIRARLFPLTRAPLRLVALIAFALTNDGWRLETRALAAKAL